MPNAARKSFDIVDNALFDLSTPFGFLLALKQTLRLKPGALLFGGVPCSSLLGVVFIWKIAAMDVYRGTLSAWHSWR